MGVCQRGCTGDAQKIKAFVQSIYEPKGEAGMSGNDLIKSEEIQSRIHTIRGVQAMPDENLALLYGVETKVLNQAVKRNSERFPEEYIFQITDDELSHLKSQIWFSKKDSLRSQNVTLDSARGKHRKEMVCVLEDESRGG